MTEKRNSPIIVRININSIRNKFDLLISRIKDDLDVLLICETKIDDSFPTAQFLMNGFSKPYRLEHSSNVWETFPYVRDNIPSRLLGIVSQKILGKSSLN